MAREEGLTESSVVRALAHPLRVRILRILDEKTASPRELAEQLGAPLGNVSYHVRTLAQLGLIKLVRRRQRRGAVEHYYRAHVRPVIADESWEAMPTTAKTAMVHANLTTAFEHAGQAGLAGGFDKPDAHLSRTTIEIDDDAWQEVSAEIGAMFERIRRLAEEANARVGANGDEARRTATVVMMLFENLGDGAERAA
jgi:DNA-binding transcriptional ArsR family regulator